MAKIYTRFDAFGANNIKDYIDVISKLQGMDLSSYVLGLSNASMMAVLADPRIREAFMKEENHYSFVWLIQDLNEEVISSFFDEKLEQLLINDSRKVDKLNAILTADKNYNSFLSRKNILKTIHEKTSELHYYLRSGGLSFEFGNAYFNYLKENDPTKISYINYLSNKLVIQLLSDKNNVNFIVENNQVKTFLRRANAEVIQEAIKVYEFEIQFLKSDVDAIAMATQEGLKLPTSFLDKEEFIQKFVDINNISKYRNIINNLNENNSLIVESIEKKRKKYYKEQVDSINKETGLLPKYQVFYDKIQGLADWKEILYNTEITSQVKNMRRAENKEQLIDKIREASNTELFEITIDMFYEEIPFDFIMSVRTMIDYEKSKESIVIDKERLEIYEKFDHYDSLSMEDKINLFKHLETKENQIANLYDDIRTCKEESYSVINKNLLKTNEKKELINEDLSKKYNLDIYELKGEPFLMLVTATRVNRESKDFEIYTDRLKTSSLSVIGDKHIGVFKSPEENLILGFSEMNIENVMHLYQSDSFTSKNYGSAFHPKIFTPDELLKQTAGYNELLYLNNKKEGHSYETNPLIPSFVVAYDEIKEADIFYSKTHNIPIVLINSQKYQISNNSFKIDDSQKTYNSKFSYDQREVDYARKR